jgi:hypothetical protein
MCKHHAKPLPPLVLGLILLGSACAVDETAGVDAQQLGGVWVFTYSETPTMSMDALGGGPASVVDDCLLLDDAVVIWHDDQLDTVEDVIERVDAGETVTLQVGGGGNSLDEGGSVDDFPDEVWEHCSPSAIWFASSEAPTIQDAS